MALVDNLTAAVDLTNPAAVTALNTAIDLINTTRAAIAVVTAAEDLPAAQAAVEEEDVTVIATHPVPRVAKAVTPVSGPPAMFGH